MTDSKTATERLREMLDALNIEHFDYDKGGRTQTQWEAPDGKRHFTYETSNNPAKTACLVIAWHPTSEQAIAATLGSDRDKVYDAGFTNGVKATLQQLDGLLMQTDSAVEIQAWVDRQWEEDVV